MATDDVQKLNLDDILTLIQGQLLEYMNSEENYETYKNLKIYLSKEQQFIKLKDKDPNALYIVVRFGAADVIFGQTVLPASIIALGPQNKLDIVQSLFFEYVQKYNQARALNDTVQQFYDSPEILENFNQLYEGYRNTLSMSAAFVIGTNANNYTVYYYYNENGHTYADEVPIISTSFAYVANPDTQAFYNSNDFTKSVIGFGGVTVGFSTFVLSDNRLINDILDVFGCVDGSENAPYVYLLGDYTSKFQLDKGIYPTDTAIRETLKAQKNEKGEALYPESMWDNLSVIAQKDDTLWRYEDKIWVEKNQLKKVPTLSKYPETNQDAKKNVESPVDKTFRLGIKFRDGKHARMGNYKLVNMTSSQELEQIPTIAVAFVE